MTPAQFADHIVAQTMIEFAARLESDPHLGYKQAPIAPQNSIANSQGVLAHAADAVGAAARRLRGVNDDFNNGNTEEEFVEEFEPDVELEIQEAMQALLKQSAGEEPVPFFLPKTIPNAKARSNSAVEMPPIAGGAFGDDDLEVGTRVVGGGSRQGDKVRSSIGFRSGTSRVTKASGGVP